MKKSDVLWDRYEAAAINLIQVVERMAADHSLPSPNSKSPLRSAFGYGAELLTWISSAEQNPQCIPSPNIRTAHNVVRALRLLGISNQVKQVVRFLRAEEKYDTNFQFRHKGGVSF